MSQYNLDPEFPLSELFCPTTGPGSIEFGAVVLSKSELESPCSGSGDVTDFVVGAIRDGSLGFFVFGAVFDSSGSGIGKDVVVIAVIRQ